MRVIIERIGHVGVVWLTSHHNTLSLYRYDADIPFIISFIALFGYHHTLSLVSLLFHSYLFAVSNVTPPSLFHIRITDSITNRFTIMSPFIHIYYTTMLKDRSRIPIEHCSLSYILFFAVV